MFFKDRLKQLRKEFDLTQEQLAVSVGTSRDVIVNLETGRANPNVNILIKLSEFFNVTTDYILGLSDIRNFEDFLDKDYVNLLFVFGGDIPKTFVKLNDYEIRLVKGFVDLLIANKNPQD